ncbi:glycosyl hydrolase family 8 [Fibrobacter sp.]|uniref:glycosyl hydrolase family 8 n=1 Tax=Fibrobacter sp. TaxID=35828 RepID=UPI0038900AB5
MNTTRISSLSLSLLLGASLASAADQIFTAPSFFDDNGAYFGPDCEQTNYNGAYYTGDYTSPFKTYLGKTDEEIQKKMDDLWNHYFKGDNNSKVFFDNGNEGYIKDINNNDVRSEGMSYGMMIAVQTGHKEEFDKLWAWAKNHMWHKGGDWDGFFAWQRGDNGQGGDDNCAPDGEMYFMMSLLFAANRWGGTYMDDAQYIMDKMWNNYNHKLFNQSNYIVVFQPLGDGNQFSDPSYDLPAYLELMSRWARKDQDKWKKAVTAARDHLYKSSHSSSGLFADYSNFDGTPHSYSYNSNATKYMYDAMRSAMNYGMDYYLFGVDSTRQIEMANRIINHFEKDGYQHARFNWDGTGASEQYTQGEAGANAVAAMCLRSTSGAEEKIKKNFQLAWDTEFMTGQYRYYDGLVHYLAMLHLSGTFKIWKPKPAAEPEKKTVEGEYNGVKYDTETTFQAFEGCKLYDVTVKPASAPAAKDTSAAAADTSSKVDPGQPGTPGDSTIAIASMKAVSAAKVWASNGAIFIENATIGSKYTVTDLNGRVLTSSRTTSAMQEVRIANKGAMLVIVGNKAFKITK